MRKRAATIYKQLGSLIPFQICSKQNGKATNVNIIKVSKFQTKLTMSILSTSKQESCYKNHATNKINNVNIINFKTTSSLKH